MLQGETASVIRAIKATEKKEPYKTCRLLSLKISLFCLKYCPTLYLMIVSVTGFWFSTDLLDKNYVNYYIMWCPNREILQKNVKNPQKFPLESCSGHVQMPSPEEL